MSKRGLILVEGQTEERFVKDTLAPLFYRQEFFLEPTLLVTKVVKSGPNFKGGVTTFARFENDVKRALKGSGGAIVTTLLDYYGLPSDFPGMASRPLGGTAPQRVEHVEQSVRDYFSQYSNFHPFFALHEFEAWLFSDTERIPQLLGEPEKQVEFAEILQGLKTPEDINERPDRAPSKRIKRLFRNYNKVLDGPKLTQKLGIELIRSKCPHFNSWIERLERIALR